MLPPMSKNRSVRMGKSRKRKEERTNLNYNFVSFIDAIWVDALWFPTEILNEDLVLQQMGVCRESLAREAPLGHMSLTKVCLSRDSRLNALRSQSGRIR